MNITIFHSKKYDKTFFTKNNTGHNLTFIEEKLSIDMGEAKLKALIKEQDAVCIFVNCKVDKKVIDILSEEKVKLILTRSAGYNHIDFQYALSKGILSARVPAYSPYAVAEHTVALLMSINRKTHRAYAKAHLNDFSLDGLVGFDIHGKTIGIVGLGKIGMLFAQIMKGFGVRIIANSKSHNPEWVKEYGVEIVDINTLWKESDIISLHTPLFPETKHIINKDSISKMKKGVVILNTSRGALINTKDLLQGLRDEQVGFVGIDVYENEESFFFENRSEEIIGDPEFMQLLQSNKVIVTPHSAFFTKEALEAISNTTFKNIDQFANGEKLENQLK